MRKIEEIIRLAEAFLTQTEKALKLAEVKQKYTVWWLNPDKGKKWDIYQSGLSKTKAETLAHKLSYVMSPRWYDHNVPTRVLPDGAVINS